MIIKELKTLIADMLDVPEDQITADARRADIESWDSLNHLQLVTAVERQFSVKLSMDEIAGIETAGDLDALVAARTAKAN